MRSQRPTAIARSMMGPYRVVEGTRSARNEAEWIRVAPAEELVDEDGVSSDGRPVGRIDSVMLEVTNGDVVYVLISAGEDYLAVPFRALDLGVWRDGQPIRINQTYQQILKNSPRTAGTLREPEV
jgi:hypothetical protein